MVIREFAGLTPADQPRDLAANGAQTCLNLLPGRGLKATAVAVRDSVAASTPASPETHTVWVTAYGRFFSGTWQEGLAVSPVVGDAHRRIYSSTAAGVAMYTLNANTAAHGAISATSRAPLGVAAPTAAPTVVATTAAPTTTSAQTGGNYTTPPNVAGNLGAIGSDATIELQVIPVWAIGWKTTSGQLLASLYRPYETASLPITTVKFKVGDVLKVSVPLVVGGILTRPPRKPAGFVSGWAGICPHPSDLAPDAPDPLCFGYAVPNHFYLRFRRAGTSAWAGALSVEDFTTSLTTMRDTNPAGWSVLVRVNDTRAGRWEASYGNAATLPTPPLRQLDTQTCYIPTSLLSTHVPVMTAPNYAEEYAGLTVDPYGRDACQVTLHAAYDDAGVLDERTQNSLGLQTTQTETLGPYTETAYIYTHVTSLGEESAPSPPSAAIRRYDTTTVTVTLPAAPVARLRLYRAAAGAWLFVGEYAPGATVTDTVLDVALGEPCPSETWLPPPNPLFGMVAMPDGYLIGFAGNSIYASAQFLPHAWPAEYRVAVNDNISRLVLAPGGAYCLCDRLTYWLDGAHPSTLRASLIPTQYGAKASASAMVVDGALYALSPEGLVRITPTGGTLLTGGRFVEDAFYASVSQTAALRYTKGRLYFTVGGVHYAYDLVTNALFTVSALPPTTPGSGGSQALGYGGVGIAAYGHGTGGGVTKRWVSKRFTFNHAACPAFGQVVSTQYPVTFTYTNFTSTISRTFTKTVNDARPFRLPGEGALEGEVSLDMGTTWTGEILQLTLTNDRRELEHA